MSTPRIIYLHYGLIGLMLVLIVVNGYLLVTTANGLAVQLLGVSAIVTCLFAIYANIQGIRLRYSIIESEKKIATLSAEIEQDLEKLGYKK